MTTTTPDLPDQPLRDRPDQPSRNLPDQPLPHEQRPAGLHDGCDCQSDDRPDRWRSGFTRRRLLQGSAGLVAALSVQQVTTRMAFSAPAANVGKDTFVVISLRGGADWQSIIVPAFEPRYYTYRPNIAIPANLLLPADRGFGFHPALAPLMPFWKSGQMAAVQAVATPDKTLSHFEAMDTMEVGVAGGNPGDGWLNRVLQVRADKGVFSAVQIGSALPTELQGPAGALALDSIDSFGLGGLDYIRARSTTALRQLYAGYAHPMAKQASDTLQALDVTSRLQKQGYTPAATYPAGSYFASALKEVARMVKAGIGLSVATLDVGGWDMHTNLGTVNNGDMRTHLDQLSAAMAAFLTDLGPALANVTVVLLTEFGRTLHENANSGTDHGRGFGTFLFGGGVVGTKVHGRWPGLAPTDGYDNSLIGTTDYRSIVGEILQKRCGVGNLAKVFPDHTVTPIGVVKPR